MLSDFLKRLGRNRSSDRAPSARGDLLRSYMALKHKPSKATALEGIRFVVFDTETSGLDLDDDRLLSIAAVGMHGFEIRLDDTFEAVVVQSDVGGADAAAVHGLVPRDLADGLLEEDAVSRFLAHARDSVLVAHHAAFDLRMLNKALRGHRGVEVWNPIVDTARLARRVELGPMRWTDPHRAHDREGYRLDSLVLRYDIETPERHTAAGDALATALLFQRLLRKAQKRGIRTLGDLVFR